MGIQEAIAHLLSEATDAEIEQMKAELNSRVLPGAPPLDVGHTGYRGSGYKFPKGIRPPTEEEFDAVFPDADEPTGMKPNYLSPYNPYYWFQYVREINNNKRLPEAEHLIMRDAELAAQYAYWILQRRWPEAEKVIKQSSYDWERYVKKYPEAAEEE